MVFTNYKFNYFFQSQLVQGHSHTRLNVSPLKEVSAKIEAAASGGHKPQPIILSPAELLKPRTHTPTPPKTPTTGSKQASPVPDYNPVPSLSKVMNMFRARSASSATAEDKKLLLQKVGFYAIVVVIYPNVTLQVETNACKKYSAYVGLPEK